jgi:GTP:adenosylcobinamide-phosphate guanylyltransferase
MKCDAVVLAGGRASAEMAALTGTPLRALFDYRGKPFVQWVYEALRDCPSVERIAIIGPEEMRDHSALRGADLLLPERESYTANLFAGVEALAPKEQVLITASDNPLLSISAFEDFLRRTPSDAALAYPYLPHTKFLERFPHATNVAIRLREGRFIGGGCVVIRSDAIEPLRSAIVAMGAARKSLLKVLRLLGPTFIARFVARRVTVAEVEQRVSRITGVTFRLVPDCDPIFAIDIDDPEDWEYLISLGS